MRPGEIVPAKPWNEFKIEDAALWDTEILSANDRAEFFDRTRSFGRRVFSEVLAPKRYGQDVNLVGMGCCLPRGYSMLVRSVLLKIEGFSKDNWPEAPDPVAPSVDISNCLLTLKYAGGDPEPLPLADACLHGLPGYVFHRRFELLEMEFFKFDLKAPPSFEGFARVKCYMLGSMSIQHEGGDRQREEAYANLLKHYGNPLTKGVVA